MFFGVLDASTSSRQSLIRTLPASVLRTVSFLAASASAKCQCQRQRQRSRSALCTLPCVPASAFCRPINARGDGMGWAGTCVLRPVCRLPLLCCRSGYDPGDHAGWTGKVRPAAAQVLEAPQSQPGSQALLALPAALVIISQQVLGHCFLL